ncbi:hypothetical protein [Palleronia sp. LCG004]|uniref:hypothetical protein n=1 Tax=Palleronia sp. LCG004 TaxID=3079304 RepID=UPI00294338DD|nr:hypothetical protein [Palleronia sp. LCG004]WOI56224.1 hypothetical protein RVY76_00060 [Palleronia sp. LCG004]
MDIFDTINGLRMRPESSERAREIGLMGYVQWLDSLPGSAPYEEEAICAYLAAMDLERSEPAVAVFCNLLRASLQRPLSPLDLGALAPRRRGGSRARRGGT